MNETEQQIVKLADTYRNPDEFIREVEELFAVPLSRKGGLFFQVGLILYERSYFALAVNSWNYVLKHFIKNDDKANESACYTGLGAAYCGLGDFRKAIEYHEKSLAIAIEIEDRADESGCYGNLGIAYNGLGDFRKAIEYYEKSLAIATEIEDRAGESRCYTGLGAAYDSLGDFRKATEYHEKSLAIAIEIEYRAGESACYTNLGNTYDSLGDFRKAIEYYEKALAIKTEIEDRAGESRCYTNLGIVYHRLGDFRKAIEYYEKALAIATEIEDRAEESRCYTNLGTAYHSLGDFGKAIKYYKKSLAIATEIEDRAGESACYAGLGNAYDSLGDFRKAIEYYEKALAITTEIGNMDVEWITDLNLCRVHYESTSKLKLAYDYCKRSIELSEVLAGRLVQEEHRIGFYARSSDAYQYMVPLCLKIRTGEEAFEYVERSKSRAFLDLVAATEIKPNVQITSKFKSLLDDERKVLAKLREVQTRHLRPTGEKVEPGEVDNILENLNQIYEGMREFDPEYVFMRSGRPLSSAKVLDMLSSESRNITLVEYFTTQEETFILVLPSKDSKLYVVTVPLSEKKIIRFLEDYRREVVNHPSFGDIGDTWLGLSDYLIEPISEFLAEGDLIYFVPHGMLHYLPLHALELDGESLIKEHPVAYIPSASLLQFCKNKGCGKLRSCASFGVVFEKESEDVAKLFKTKAYHQATKDTVLKNLTDKNVIHFSCHGYFNSEDPLSSGVKLYDQVLTAREIFDLKLDTELVTLSACETGLSEASPGDELIGLTRAFLYAGSPSVIVSLWSVDARSTQELMIEFYKALKDGSDKATALQKAQKSIMLKEDYSHPYYWAPFVLIGDWEVARWAIS